MLRAVLDANVFVSALIKPAGPPGQVLRRFLDGRSFMVLVTSDLVAELRRTLSYPRLRKYVRMTEQQADAWVESLVLLAEGVEPVEDIHAVSADPDDDIYIMAAAGGRADYLVTGDHHLLDLKAWRRIPIVTPKDFLRVLDS